MHSFQAGYLGTVARISNFFLQAYRRGAHGRPIIVQLKKRKQDVHAVACMHAYTTFCRLWRSLLPSVIIIKSMTDLCWTCHQYSTAILRAANCSEANKSTTIKDAEEHLRIVQVDSSFYKSACDACRESVRAFFSVDGEFQPPSLSSNTTPNSNDIKVHYSFDYA